MSSKGLKEGDQVWIEDGKSYGRVSNPTGRVLVEVSALSSFNSEKFYGNVICPEGVAEEGYWYKTYEIIQPPVSRSEKGKPIGGKRFFQ